MQLQKLIMILVNIEKKVQLTHVKANVQYLTNACSWSDAQATWCLT